MMKSYLDAHVKQLLTADSHFREYWTARKAKEQRRYREIWATIEAAALHDGDILDGDHGRAFDLTKRWFVRVQEKDFAYTRIRADWWSVARDPKIQEHLLRSTSDRIEAFIESTAASDKTFWHGGIKPAESLHRKLLQEKTGDAVQRRVLDLWDVIRFRIVANELDDILTTCLQFWETFFDDIVRCRNYYYRPRNTSGDDAYRAIHFELSDREGNIAEVQVMTARRDAMSVLDHWHVFKRSGTFIDDGHRTWLLAMSRAANILDARAFREDSGALQY